MGKDRRKRAFWWFLAVLCCVPLVAVVWRTRSAQAAVQREVVALRKLGVPTSAAEMRGFTAVPDADNAAPFYRKAIESLKTHGKDEPSGRPDATLEARVRKWVVDNEPTLALVEEASKKPACDFKRPWEQGIDVLFREMSDLRAFTKLAVKRAEMEAEKGRFDESMRWLRVGDNVAFHADEPILIGMLVSIACEAIVHAELQSQLEAYGRQPSFRQAAAAFLANENPLPSLARGLIGEVFLVRTAMDQVRSGTFQPGDIEHLSIGGLSSASGGPFTDLFSKLHYSSLKMPIVNAQVEAILLRRYRVAYEQMRGGKEPLQAQMKASEKLDSELVGDGSWAGVLAEIFVPVFSQAGDAGVKLAAMRRLSRAGLALWTMRAQTGRFPAALPKESWAIDPFTGKPFVYVPGKGRFKLYSVGTNRKDDGGDWTAAKNHTDDVEYGAIRNRGRGLIPYP